MKNEIVEVTNNELLKEKPNYCSVDVTSLEAKKNLINSLDNADVLLNDCKGQVIKIKDVYIEKGSIVDEKTGEVKDKYRTILFDMDGKSYATGSYGVYNAITKIFMAFGHPTWEDGIEVEVKEAVIKKTGKSKLTLVLV